MGLYCFTCMARSSRAQLAQRFEEEKAARNAAQKENPKLQTRRGVASKDGLVRRRKAGAGGGYGATVLEFTQRPEAVDRLNRNAERLANSHDRYSAAVDALSASDRRFMEIFVTAVNNGDSFQQITAKVLGSEGKTTVDHMKRVYDQYNQILTENPDLPLPAINGIYFRALKNVT